EIIHIAYSHNAMIAARSRNTLERTFSIGECLHIAAGNIVPGTWCFRHETNFENAISVIKAVYQIRTVFTCKLCSEFYIPKRIATISMLEFNFTPVPLLYRLRGQ